MPINLKDSAAIEKMRIAGKLAAEVLEMIDPFVKKGVNTAELDRICHDYIVNTQNAIPAPLNYGQTATRAGFPNATCISVNEVICHGIPSKTKTLKSGDIVNIDVTVIKDGYHGDTSKMYIVDKALSFNERLVVVAQECLYKGIEVAKPGNYLSDIANKIARHARNNGYSVVEDYCGHGIGEIFHEDPQVLHYPEAYKERRNDIQLVEGMTFTIEPMINAGKKTTKLLADQWTVVTKDRSNSAQWEHTLLITATGCDILTKRNNETI
jgi:methionyl aminopeptidase